METAGTALVLPECFTLPAVSGEEGRGVVWADHPARKTINCNLGRVDLSAYRAVTLHLHSAVANNAFLVLVIGSENPETNGPDYYRYDFYVDWEGERALTFNLASAKVGRSPLGWRDIDSIKFWSDFGGIVPLADTKIIIRSIEFHKSPGTEGDAAVSPRPEFSASGQVQQIRERVQVVSQSTFERPNLLISKDDFARVRRRIDLDHVARQWFEMIRRQADQALTAGPSEYEKIGKRLLHVSRQVLGRVYSLGLVYQVTGEEKYAARAWSELEAAAAFTDWNPDHFLDTAEMTHAFAIGYDWLYDYLTEEQRQLLRRAILELGLHPALETYRGPARGGDRHGWRGRTDNWNIVSNSGVAMGALALIDTEPAIAAEVLVAAIESLPRALAQFGPDGGYEEGLSYWHYALRYFAVFAAALDTVLGTDFGLSQIAGVAVAGDFPVYATGPTGNVFDFGDAGSSMNPEVMFWLARKFATPEYASWRLDTIKTPHPADLIWYALTDEQVIETADYADLPLDRYFRGVEIAALRSAWRDPEAVYVAVKAGRNQAPHGDLDLGDFVLEALGVRWAVELGSEDYDLPGYWSMGAAGERWTYYRKRAEGQNTLVINSRSGPDQNPLAVTEVEHFSANEDEGLVIMDLTSAYENHASRVRRGIALMDQRRQVIVQDEVKLKAPGTLSWFMHTRSTVRLEDGGRSAVLQQDGKQLYARLLEPADAVFQVMDAVPLPASPQRTDQTPNPGVRKLAVHLEHVTDTRIVVLFTPVVDNTFPGSAPTVVPLDAWISISREGGTIWHASDRMRLTLQRPRLGDVVRGEFDLVGSLEGVSPSAVESVRVLVDEHVVYVGKDLPMPLRLDSLQFEDGFRNLFVRVTTRDGGLATASTCFRVDNWWEIDYDMRPPLRSSWFAAADPSQPSQESPGWVYVTGEADTFYGDDHRRVRSANTEEYLIWDRDNLHRVEVTVYVKSEHAADIPVELAVREAGGAWRLLEPRVEVVDVSAGGWLRVQLEDEMLPNAETHGFRLLVKPEIPADALQLGHVWLQGMAH